MTNQIKPVPTDPITITIAERIQELLAGRIVNPTFAFVNSSSTYFPAITIDSCYHFHTITFVNGQIVMHVKHKYRMGNDLKPTGRTDIYEFDLSDPHSFDQFFEEVERTSEHAP